MGELSGLVRSERLALIEFLETLTPDEWAVPSLCSGWTVQDVAAHLAWAPALRPLEAMLGLVRGGFRLNRVNADHARLWSSRGREAILEQLRVNAAKGLRPPGTPEGAALADAVCHFVDIRRPLGKSGPVNEEAFPVVADFFAGLRWPLTILVNDRSVPSAAVNRRVITKEESPGATSLLPPLVITFVGPTGVWRRPG